MPHRPRTVVPSVAACVAAVLVLTGAATSPTSSPTPTSTPGPTTSASPSDPVASETSTPTETPSPTETTPPAATVTLDSVRPRRIVEDTDVVRLVGTAEPGSVVEVWTRHAGREAVRRATVTVGDDGAWEASRLVRRPGSVQVWVSAGEETTGIVEVTVVDRTNLITTTTSRVPGLSRWRVQGTVSHAASRMPLRIQVRRDGRWRPFRDVRTAADGTYSFRIPTRWPGASRYRTVVDVTTRDVERSAPYRARVVKRLRPTVTTVTAADLSDTYRRGCPVGPDGLRKVTFVHQRYDGSLRWGRIVVREGAAVAWTKDVFGEALATGFRFREIRPVEAYDGSDPKSMAADNTSAFNCRHVTGNPYALSPHSYGTAFDLNPRRNPYQDVTGTWWPSGSEAWRDRSNRRTGMLFRDSPVTRTFLGRGLQWGGFWSHPDYQHFDP